MARIIPLRDFGSARVRTPLVNPGQRVGILGGTFNPPHEGHVIIAEAALKRLALDQLWWVVTPGNPLKGNDGLPPLAERMAACRRLAQGPRMKITGFEADLGTPYTAATLAYLKRRYPGVRFVWVMGADNLATFHRWQRWTRIAETCPIAVVDRPGWRLRALASPAARRYSGSRRDEGDAGNLATRKPAAWTFLTTRLSRLSSTELRAKKSISRR